MVNDNSGKYRSNPSKKVLLTVQILRVNLAYLSVSLTQRTYIDTTHGKIAPSQAATIGRQ